MFDEKVLYSIVKKAKKYDELVKINRNFEPHCSFCGKSQSAVETIIVGAGVCICNECIELCNELLEDSNNKKNNLIEPLKEGTEV